MRISFIQQCYGRSDPAMDEELRDVSLYGELDTRLMRAAVDRLLRGEDLLRRIGMMMRP